MNVCQNTNILAYPTCPSVETGADFNKSNISLNLMASIGLINLFIFKCLLEEKRYDFISKKELFLSSVVFGSINSLYYARAGASEKESAREVKSIKDIADSFMKNYFAPAQLSLLVVSISVGVIGNDLFELISSLGTPPSYFMGLGSSAYTILDALSIQVLGNK